MAGLFHRRLNGRGGHRSGPHLEFAPLDDATGIVGLHFQDNPPGRGRNLQFLPPRNAGGLTEFPRQHDPIGSVQFDGCFHGMTMARFWQGGKRQRPVLRRFARRKGGARHEFHEGGTNGARRG